MANHTETPAFHTSECAPWGERCEVHPGTYHYQCADCGVECTMLTPGGPATTEIDGITRCWRCNRSLPRFSAVGKDALMARAASDLLSALKAIIEAQRKTLAGYLTPEMIRNANSAIDAAEGRAASQSMERLGRP